MKDCLAKNLLANLRALFSINIRKSISENAQKIASIESSMEAKLLYLGVLNYYAFHEQESGAYSKELDYLRQHGCFCNFPYPSDAQPIKVVSGFDGDLRMSFVIHKGKRLYFPSDVTEEDAIWYYRNYVQTERLLGTDDDEGTPHQYQSPEIQVSDGDVVFDIGAAEGLFALDQIDKASHVVIVESNPDWMEALRHTFAPFGDKVTLVQKFISATDTESTLSLKKLLTDTEFSSAFIKMDIEGYELPAINAAVVFLKEKPGIKIAAAAYHRQNDAEELKAIFDKLGYTSEFSNGYMLFHQYDTPLPPYFRRGMVRAKNSI